MLAIPCLEPRWDEADHQSETAWFLSAEGKTTQTCKYNTYMYIRSTSKSNNWKITCGVYMRGLRVDWDRSTSIIFFRHQYFSEWLFNWVILGFNFKNYLLGLFCISCSCVKWLRKYSRCNKLHTDTK